MARPAPTLFEVPPLREPFPCRSCACAGDDSAAAHWSSQKAAGFSEHRVLIFGLVAQATNLLHSRKGGPLPIKALICTLLISSIDIPQNSY